MTSLKYIIASIFLLALPAFSAKAGQDNCTQDKMLSLIQDGNFVQMTADCTAAIQLKPDNTIAYFYRALSYRYQNQLKLAIEDYTKAIEFNPEYADAYHNRSLLYQKLGQINKANKDMAKYKQLEKKQQIIRGVFSI